MSNSVWGATPEEWTHLSDKLALTADLLPVVSNTGALISPKSKLRDVGKTPSRYDRERRVVGIPQWTDNHSSTQDIARWQRDNDIGICIQTRLVRAIDIDVPDPDAARRVRDCVEMLVGDLPVRMRGNSGKCLLVFKLEGGYTKRILRTAHGPIEFLATGQQFIAVGTHPSGARYEWEGGLPDEIPYLTGEEFEAMWSALEKQFGVAASVSRGPGAKPSTQRQASELDDDVLTFLERTGWVKSIDSQGRAHITCPWEHEHTGGGGDDDSSTTYFPRGVGGFEQGHFRCLHAHCEGRTDGDFIEAVGYVLDDFAVVEPQPGDTELPLLLPPFERDRQGNILATVTNVERALRRADVCGVHVGYDAFNDEIMLADFGTKDWRAFTDADYVRLRIKLEGGGFKPIGRELVRDVVALVADDNKFDSAQLWLGTLTWDGVPRIERFWSTYFQADDTDYVRSCGTYIWTAMAGRVLSPGVKADMVPILVGEQGVGKTTGVAAMVPAEDHFMEVKLDDQETEMARRMRGKLVGEIGELRGLHSREIEHVKAFVTRTHEEWVPKYKEFSIKFPRRLVFIGTTNNDEFLADETGNRRWLPIRVGQTNLEKLKAERDQLWAEAAVRFNEGGVQFREAQSLATNVHAEHTITDPWEDPVRAWLADAAFGADGGTATNGSTPFRIGDVLQGALGFDPKHVSRREELRVGRVLRKMGYDKRTVRMGDTHRAKLWALAEKSKFDESAENSRFDDLA